MAQGHAAPHFSRQILVLQTKNMKTLSRNRRRLLMLFLYPIYFVALLSILKSSSKAQKAGFWESSHKHPIQYEFPDSSIAAYSCDISQSQCDLVMELVKNKTGLDIVSVQNTIDYWKQNEGLVVAGIEITSLSVESSCYVLRLDNDELETALSYGSYGVAAAGDSKPTKQSQAYQAYVSSGFAYLQRSLDCSIAEYFTGNNVCDFDLSVKLFPVSRFKTFYSSDSSLTSLVPFYMVIAFCNVIIFVVINIVIEKETKMVETLSMHGMSLVVYWASWQVTIGIIGAVTCAACTILLDVMNLFPNTDTLLVFIVFFLYNMTLVPIAFVISTFFHNERVAGLVGGMGSIVVGAPAFALSSLSSAPLKNSLALFPPLAMAEALAVVMDSELDNDGVTWRNISESREGFSFLNGILFLVFDFFFYFALAWYLYQVLPNNSGVRKHPLFCFYGSAVIEDILVESSSHALAHLIEPVSADLLVTDASQTVKIRSLCKNYVSESGAVVQALENLSLDMYQGQIFALLGHNGAGKSTTISLLTGLTSKSSGEAQILGYDMDQSMDKIRSSMGYVPQHDTLFLALTVDENLAVFAGLKGASMGQASELLQKLGLEASRNVIASNLSGGQKRSLSIAIALIGQPKFLVLDEPTAGMDPVSRRRVWDVLLERKAERITLLTTHFLDEADVLGDRIAILAHGRLECLGSPLFLKTHLGVGYHLTAVPFSSDASAFSKESLISFIQHRVADCTVGDSGDGGVHVTIPMSASTEMDEQGERSKMASLLLDLDANLASLGLNTYGISLTTLEEVFINIASGYNSNDVSAVKPGGTIRVRAFEESRAPPSLSTQCSIVMKARMLVARRAVAFNVAVICVPVICVAFSLLLQSLIHTKSPITNVTPKSYSKTFGDTDLWWNGVPSQVPSCLNELSVDHTLAKQGVTSKGLESALADQSKNGKEDGAMYAAFSLLNSTSELEDLCSFGNGYSSYRGDWILYFNQSRVNSLPAFLSLFNGVTMLGDQNAFQVTAALLESDDQKEVSVSDIAVALTLTYLIGLSFAPFGVTYAYEVVKDRQDGRQHQWHIMGVSPIAIWGSAALIDLCRWCIPFGLIFCVMEAYQSDMLLSHGAFYALVVVVILVGIQTVLGAYTLGHFIESPDFVTTTLSPIVVLCTMVFYTVVWTALVSTVGFTEHFAPYALMLTVVGGIALPPFLIMSAFSFVIHLSAYGLDYPSDPSVYLGWSTSCPYSNSNTCFGISPILLSACISIALSMLFLSGFMSKLRHLIFPPTVVQSIETEQTEIPEVKQEEARVMTRNISVASPSSRKTTPVVIGEQWLLDDEEQRSVLEGDDTVLIQGLRKEFPSSAEGPKVAVHNMCLGIKRGECFGLLGHNGAGKTSLIGMLTGMLEPTRGDAFVDGFSVRTQRAEVLQNTGFCPQFGGNWPSMTLREHLEMYAGLRGFDIETDKELLDEIETGLAVQEHSSKLVSELSGGNRRKLSAALALIGGPHIVYLDEPSTGVDAATRRHLWEFIAGNQAGRATVLTTHSMEEADILAGRIGIMVGGRLRALGTPQELKSKHGSEWQLDMKLKTETPSLAGESSNTGIPEIDTCVQNIMSFLTEHLPGVRLTESFADSVRFLVPAGSLSGQSGSGLGASYNLIELNKPGLGIKEFSLSQTTLENVFLNVAKEDEEPHLMPPS